MKNNSDELRSMLTAEEREEYDDMAISAMFGTSTVANEKRTTELENIAQSRLLAREASAGVGTAQRDQVAVWLVNRILRLLASQQYRSFVKGAIEYGMRSAARDVKEGREAPGDWRSNDESSTD